VGIDKLAISILWFRRLGDNNRSGLNGNNRNLDNGNNRVRGIALSGQLNLMEHDNIYEQIYDIDNLILAWRKARKHKTKKDYVIEFEQDTMGNLLQLSEELKHQSYRPQPLKTFILRDPKTRKISKSAFRDRIVHHALVRVLEPIFDKSFIYDSCANRIGKGTLFALNRYEVFKRKITKNKKREAFCFKADIRHYFEEVDHEILIQIIRRKVSDEKVIFLIRTILINISVKGYCTKGMPLGNLTSQFFANVYLDELDYFIKHTIKAKYYIRYVDDFVILHDSKLHLEKWKSEISEFLKTRLKLEMHPQKSKVSSLSGGVDFVGFRNYWHFRLLRKRNIKKMLKAVDKYRLGEISKERLLESFQGWNAYAKWANSYRLRKRLVMKIYAP
jgi:retron-type reverse transcriptase